MVKRIAFLLILGIAFLSCNNPATKTDEEVKNDSVKTETVDADVKETICTGTVVDSILSNPEAFVGQELAMCGVAIHICQHSGDKLFLANCNFGEEYIVVMAGDEMETFDNELLNKHVMIEGVLVKMEDDDEVEIHHDKAVVYYIECSKVNACTCEDYDTEAQEKYLENDFDNDHGHHDHDGEGHHEDHHEDHEE